MVGFSMCCAQVQEQIQDLSLTGGASESIFPLVESYLKEDDHSKALLWAAKRSSKGYRSIMDWLVCEVFSEERPKCRAYYKGQGPKLKEIISENCREFYERVLLNVVKVAYEKHKANQRVIWSRLKQEAVNL
jgi:hypothetical protein